MHQSKVVQRGDKALLIISGALSCPWHDAGSPEQQSGILTED